MSIAHKIEDEWLVSHAAGALSKARSLLLASHVTYHEDLQETLADAEAIGGALLDSAGAADVSPVFLDNLLSRLDDNPEPARLEPPASAGDIPVPLYEFIGCGLKELRWRMMGPGMSNARLWNGPNDERLWLLKARGGVRVPEHGHNGEEWTLILKGSYQTESGRFGVGDIEVADEGITHQPIIDQGEDCICLVVTQGPIRLKSPLARLAQPFIGL